LNGDLPAQQLGHYRYYESNMESRYIWQAMVIVLVAAIPSRLDEPFNLAQDEVLMLAIDAPDAFHWYASYLDRSIWFCADLLYCRKFRMSEAAKYLINLRVEKSTFDKW
jgi:hypothetical protein